MCQETMYPSMGWACAWRYRRRMTRIAPWPVWGAPTRWPVRPLWLQQQQTGQLHVTLFTSRQLVVRGHTAPHSSPVVDLLPLPTALDKVYVTPFHAPRVRVDPLQHTDWRIGRGI